MTSISGRIDLLWKKLRIASQPERIDMTELTAAVQPKQKAGVRKQRKHGLKIDMTPMVDLGFLLISFFVITTELSKPVAMNLAMPADGPDMPLGESDALTVIPIADNTAWYYEGKGEDAVRNGTVYQTSIGGSTGLRDIIISKQAQLDANPASREKRNGLMLVIKPSADCSYKNLVDILDEISITQVKKYAVAKLTDEEAGWLKTKR